MARRCDESVATILCQSTEPAQSANTVRVWVQASICQNVELCAFGPRYRTVIVAVSICILQDLERAPRIIRPCLSHCPRLILSGTRLREWLPGLPPRSEDHFQDGPAGFGRHDFIHYTLQISSFWVGACSIGILVSDSGSRTGQHRNAGV